eukprot:jgi/Botrbrau1/23635/Bobra.55_2s0022.1
MGGPQCGLHMRDARNSLRSAPTNNDEDVYNVWFGFASNRAKALEYLSFKILWPTICGLHDPCGDGYSLEVFGSRALPDRCTGQTQVKEALGDCNDAHSTILESVLPSPYANEVIQSAVLRTYWKVRQPNYPAQTMYLRTIPVQDILTKDQLSTNFPSATSLLGPASYMQMQIYGRDLSYPLLPAVAATYAHIGTHTYQDYSHLVITRAWSARPATSNKPLHT